MRTSITLFLAIGLVGIGASSVEGQLNLNAGLSYAEALEGQWGVEARVVVSPPGFPVDLFGGADYFFSQCDEECSLWGWRAGANLRMATPSLQPYLTGAYVGRKWELGDRRLDRTGLALGGGIRVGLGKLRIYTEITREFLGNDLNQWVFRIGLG